MPRTLRIETNEGLYHVINRGNYRDSIFREEGAKAAFEKCLFEACDRSGWRLHAYCLMDNHFHLCISTPRGNLSEGMRWLQSTYAARFNRFRREIGHLFQGRFKSLVVEQGKHFCDLVDYIHLNPARAGLAAPATIKLYRWSSLHWFSKVKTRPSALDPDWMRYLDGVSDSTSGWRSYASSLQMRHSEDPAEIELLERRMCRGWCIGEKDFKAANSRAFLAKKETLRLEKDGLADLNESHWEGALAKCLKKIGESQASAMEAKLSADWKLAIAVKMKGETSVKNAWLSKRLNMGTPRGVSSNCGVYAKRKSRCPIYRKLKDLTFDV